MNRLLAVVPRRPDAHPAIAGALAHVVRERSWWAAVCPTGPRDTTPTGSLARAVAAAFGEDRSSTRPVVLLDGPEALQWHWLRAIVAWGVRPRVRIVLRARCARLPIAPGFSPLYRLADLVVADSDLGVRAVRACVRPRRTTEQDWIVSIPAPAPAVDHQTESPHRASLRVACALEGCEAALRALQIFHAFAEGAYHLCGTCGGLTPFPTDFVAALRPVTRCAACGSTSGERGRRRPDAQLHLFDRAEEHRPVELRGPWTVADAATYLGLADRVVLHDDTEDPITVLAGSDIHLAPHDLADVAPAVLASCVCGVATVTTRFGAASEALSGVVRLVPPAMELDDSAGHRVAVMDVGRAVAELVDLADHPDVRRAEGARAREYASALSPGTIAARWLAHLSALAT